MNPNEEFRDSIGTINEDGKRAWVYTKKTSGKFYNARQWVSYFLIAFLVVSPFIKINGNQFLMFNILERRFSIFGMPFWPQDFFIFVICLIIGIVFVALFTVAFGRIFCGWICPQTIFMEFLFRKIEFWVEGDRGAQIRLDRQQWNAEKIRKKATKWILFFLVSFIVANVFLAYLVGSDKLFQLIEEGPIQNLSNFIALLIFTGVFYFIFGWFREQVCIIACPYGRLQGVLLDNKSVIVAYDYVRGEKEKGRSKFDKRENRELSGKGDCIDCHQCVAVCPTGIDIRNGTQMECIGCTACVDECNIIMDRVGLPQGLIRYASEDEITKKEKFKFTARMKGYTAVLVILIGVLAGTLFLRSDLETSIVRIPGQLFEHKGENISNVYTFKILNKTNKDFENIRLEITEPDGKLIMVGEQTKLVPKGERIQGTLFIEIHPAFMNGQNKRKVKVAVYEGEKLIETTSTTFLGPQIF